MPHYGRAFSLWRTAATETTDNIWHAYTHHPFVEKLADGTLSQEAYLHYLVQDYVFLVHFSRAWAMAVVKSETLHEMKLASATVNALVNIEMQHHIDICAGHGIDEQALFDAIEEPENLAYTRYVLDAGLSGDLADLLAALAPCIFGYGEIGKRLIADISDTHPYAAWIETYASDSYQQVCLEVGELIDAVLDHRIGADFTKAPRWRGLTERFMTASKLETAFWGMALR